MSVEQLYGLMPHYDRIEELAQRAAEINAYAARGEITAEEHQALLEDLVRTQMIIDEANWHEKKLFFDQVVAALSHVPLPG